MASRWAIPAVCEKTQDVVSASEVETQFRKKVIRVRKQDSAYVYFILESYEGIVSYSTLAHQTGDPHRDLELRYSVSFQSEVEELLRTLSNELGDSLHELGAHGS
jgi:hypothetical protein